MKVAKVRLSWKPSVSPDVKSQTVAVTIDGVPTLSSEVDPAVSEVVIDVAASSSVIFTVLTTDTEGQSTQSEIYSFTLGDLVAPQPATDLFHEVISVLDQQVDSGDTGSDAAV